MSDDRVRIAVVTGGHGFDLVRFHDLFHQLEGVQPYIQHMDDFCSASQEIRDGYEVVVFYTMLMEGPSDEGQLWYAGKPREALGHLGQTTQGIVLLHHAILAYPQWTAWNEMVGIEERSFSYHVGESIHVDVADAEHPITRGVQGWEMVDETYTMAEPGEGSHLLLTVDHPKSMKTIAWTREYGRSRVFCLQSGHDDQTWQDVHFQATLERGIRWCAGRM